MRWFTDLRDLALLTGLSTGLGLAVISAHGLPLVAPPPDPSTFSCGDDEAFVAMEEPVPSVPRIAVDDVAARIGRPGITVVDARAGDAFERGHVPGALHLPAFGAEDLLRDQSMPIPPDDLVVIYCDGEAAELSEYLGTVLKAQVGCREVRVIEGGWTAWLSAGAPVEGELVSG